MPRHLDIRCYAHPQAIGRLDFLHNILGLASKNADIYLFSLDQFPYLYLFLENLKGKICYLLVDLLGLYQVFNCKVAAI